MEHVAPGKTSSDVSMKDLKLNELFKLVEDDSVLVKID